MKLMFVTALLAFAFAAPPSDASETATETEPADSEGPSCPDQCQLDFNWCVSSAENAGEDTVSATERCLKERDECESGCEEN